MKRNSEKAIQCKRCGCWRIINPAEDTTGLCSDCQYATREGKKDSKDRQVLDLRTK